jgi:hypothetical protein
VRGSDSGRLQFPSYQDVEIQPLDTKDIGPDPGPQLLSIEEFTESTRLGGGPWTILESRPAWEINYA